MRMDQTHIVHTVRCCGGCGVRLPRGPSLRQTLMALVLAVFLQLHSSIAEHMPSTFAPADLITFQDDITKYYRYMSIDPNHGTVYVGAMEYLYKLDASNISSFTRSGNLSNDANAEWIIRGNRDSCVNKGKSPDFDCRNHVRAVIVHDDYISLCSTGAYNPQDYELNLADLNVRKVGARGSGRAKCPYDPNDNATCVFVRNGNPGGIPSAYSGTVSDFTKLDPVIYRPGLGDFNLLRTVPQDSKSLYEPNFVGSFDVGDYVYFFFRETAIEYINCGRAIYSRVARVCKNDRGGSSVLENKWTTYLKARLNCSIPGEFPYYFNEIHDVFRDGNNFYGVFATNVNGLYGSAVCSFLLSDIEAAFQGDFKEQTDSSSNWQRVPESKVPTPRPGSCNDNSQELPDNVLQFIKARPLMDQSVTHQGGRPLYHQKDVIFQRMAVHQQDQYTVFFLGTNQGSVYKVVQWQAESENKSKLLAIYKPLGDLVLPIWEMKLHNDHLYIATDQKVVEFPVKQCKKYIKCTECVQDPHCLWHEWTLECQPYTRSLPSNFKRSVETLSPLKTCSGQCANTGRAEEPQRVKLARDPVHLHCDSHCDPEGPVVWTFGGERIEVDNKRYFLTSSNGLIIFNVTYADSGTYQCTSLADTGSYVVLRQRKIDVTRCTEPECHWKEEFQNWCSAFDEYKSQLDHWKCLKNGCLSDSSCIPNIVNTQCAAP